MDTVRLELADGQWAEFRTRLTHGQAKAINHVILAEKAGNADDVDFVEAVVFAFCTGWRVRGLDAAELTWPAQWELAPDEFADAIGVRAQELWVEWRQSADPLGRRGSNPSSPDSSPEATSA